jgi:hypothetical protein
MFSLIILKLSNLFYNLISPIACGTANSDVRKEVLATWTNMEINFETVKHKVLGIKRDLTSAKYE